MSGSLRSILACQQVYEAPSEVSFLYSDICCWGECRVPEECSQDIKALMDRCLSLAPSQRPSAKQVVEALVAAQQAPNLAAALLPGRSRRTSSLPSATATAAIRACRPAPPPHLAGSTSAVVSAVAQVTSSPFLPRFLYLA